jgi:hypothetical protein
MGAPDPLHGLDDDAIVELLVDAGRDEAPSPEARHRARSAALTAVGASVAAGVAVGSGATVSASAAASSGAAGTATAKGLALVPKWLLMAALPGVAAVSGVAFVGYQAMSPSPTPPATPAPTSAAQPPDDTPLPASPASDEDATPEADDLSFVEPPMAAPQRPRRRSPRARAERTSPPSPAKGAELGDEIRALDAARRAALRGDVAHVDAYLAAHPRGRFHEQARVLRVEALARAGRTTEARRAAQRFLADHPESVHGARLRRFVQ